MTKPDYLTRRSCVVAFAFLGQLSYVHRTFSIANFAPILLGLMLAALCWMNHKYRFLREEKESVVGRFVWVPIVVVAFFVSESLLPGSASNRLVAIAQSIVFATLVGQIAIVATKGIARTELLVLAAVTSILSLVCFGQSIVLYQQITEAGIAICLFAMLAGVTSHTQLFSNQAGSTPRILVYTVVLLMIILASRPVAIAMDSWMPALKAELFGAIEEGALESLNSPSVVSRYVSTGSLNDVVDQFEREPKAIVLRVFADQEPGYLRGTVFDRYHKGRWQQHRPERTQSFDEDMRRSLSQRTLSPESTSTALELTGEVARRDKLKSQGVRSFLFDRRASGKTVTLEIENDPRRGSNCFSPLRTSRVDGVSRRLVIDPHGIVQSGLDTRHTYFATVHQDTSAEPLSVPLRELALDVPQEIASAIDDMAKKICENASTPRDKAQRISNFFQDNFRYSTERRAITEQRDPVVNFVTTRHPAHCEYFASATALMLRSQGVPAQYVTGYVITEHADEGDVWLGRNTDAHAWVEAYDDRSNRWFTVESTPGRDAKELIFASGQSATANAVTANDTVTEGQWFIANWRLWVLLRSGQWTQFLVELSEQMRWPLMVTTGGLVIAMIRRRHSSIERNFDIYGLEYSRLLSAADHRMKRLGLHRAKTETMHRFASRIEDSCDAPKLTGDWATWYRKFAELRYRSLPPTDLGPFPR